MKKARFSVAILLPIVLALSVGFTIEQILNRVNDTNNSAMRVNLVAGSVSAGDIEVGTTTLTGGTNKYCLFDDNGVVGEDAGCQYDKALDQLLLAGSLRVTGDGGSVTLTSEANVGTDILQLGVDGSGSLNGQHITSADQTGTGLAAALTVNPGASAGTNQSGATLTLAGGFSTGNVGSAIALQTSTPGSSGTGVNAPANRLFLTHAGAAFYVPPIANSDGSVDLGAASFRFRDLLISRDAKIGGRVTVSPQAVTCADSGNGSLATLTITPTTSSVRITNSDADGCTVTMSETGAVDGSRVTLTVVSNAGGTVDISDTSGVTETSGAFNMAAWDKITFEYVTDRWVEETRSNN